MMPKGIRLRALQAHIVEYLVNFDSNMYPFCSIILGSIERRETSKYRRVVSCVK